MRLWLRLSCDYENAVGSFPWNRRRFFENLMGNWRINCWKVAGNDLTLQPKGSPWKPATGRKVPECNVAPGRRNGLRRALHASTDAINGWLLTATPPERRYAVKSWMDEELYHQNKTILKRRWSRHTKKQKKTPPQWMGRKEAPPGIPGGVVGYFCRAPRRPGAGLITYKWCTG